MGLRAKRAVKGAVITVFVLVGVYLLGELLENRAVRRVLRVLEGVAGLGMFVFLFRGDDIIFWWKNRKRRALLRQIAQGVATHATIEDRLTKIYAKYPNVEDIPLGLLDSMHRGHEVVSKMHAVLEPLIERARKVGISDDEIEREIERHRKALESRWVNRSVHE